MNTIEEKHFDIKVRGEPFKQNNPQKLNPAQNIDLTKF